MHLLLYTLCTLYMYYMYTYAHTQTPPPYTQALEWEQDALLTAETALLRYKKRMLTITEHTTSAETTADLTRRHHAAQERVLRLQRAIEGPPLLQLAVPVGAATCVFQGRGGLYQVKPTVGGWGCREWREGACGVPCGVGVYCWWCLMCIHICMSPSILPPSHFFPLSAPHGAPIPHYV